MNPRPSPPHLRWDAAVDCSLRLRFDGPQPDAFGIPRASATPLRAGAFVGDTRLGGSVNCFDVALNPHGNGTHTECVGHIATRRVHVVDHVPLHPLRCVLVTAPPTLRAESGESYPWPDDGGADRVITRAALERAWRHLADRIPDPLDAIAIRSRDNDGLPPSAEHASAYFTAEAMAWIRQRGVSHLLCDLASVDREQDGGLLANHRTFWSWPDRGQPEPETDGRRGTITELAAFPASLPDAPYALLLQIPAFELDAAPSRPLLVPLASDE